MADMGQAPTKQHSIDRIDNNGNYEPENCRWATRQEQALNRRDNRMLSFDGKTQPLTLWAREMGIDVNTLRARLRKGMSVSDALTTPVRGRRR